MSRYATRRKPNPLRQGLIIWHENAKPHTANQTCDLLRSVTPIISKTLNLLRSFCLESDLQTKPTRTTLSPPYLTTISLHWGGPCIYCQLCTCAGLTCSVSYPVPCILPSSNKVFISRHYVTLFLKLTFTLERYGTKRPWPNFSY